MHLLLLLLACSPPVASVTPGRAYKPTFARPGGEVLTVSARLGAGYSKIMDAVKDAHSGDTILVEPGTYEGSITFQGKALTISSTDGPELTTIVATSGKSAVKVNDGEGPGTLLGGFTITGGGGDLIPAIDEEFSALTLSDDIITGNEGNVTIYARSGHLILLRSTVEDNTASEGMVIQDRRGETLVINSTVRCGDSAIGYITEHGAAFTDGSTYDCPDAIAVEVFHSQGRVERAIIDGLVYVENEGTGSEGTVVEDSVLLGGASVVVSDLTLRNVVSTGTISASAANLVVEGSIITGATCGLDVSGSSAVNRNNDFWDNATDTCGMTSPVGKRGNIDADPLFVDAAAHDFQLSTGSPCANTGPTDDGYLDPDGTPNDMGAYGGPLSLGGGW